MISGNGLEETLGEVMHLEVVADLEGAVVADLEGAVAADLEGAVRVAAGNRK
jgi:hypothetical protein